MRNPHFQRGLQLLKSRRLKAAEEAFRAALLDNPHDSDTHGLLALILADLERWGEATDAAEVAISEDPENPDAHYARGYVMYQRNRFADALESINEAIALDNEDERYFWIKAAIFADQKKWAEAEAAAREGLEIDPEDEDCANLLTLALRKQGQSDEAEAVAKRTLEFAPEDATTHAELGWGALHRGDHQTARTHFVEALRLKPNHRQAQSGLLESIKAKNLFYRQLLRFQLWLGTLGRGARWGIIIGLWALYRLSVGVLKTHPELSGVMYFIMALYLGFAFSSWSLGALLDFFLLFHPTGKFAVTREKKPTAIAIGGLYAGTILGIGAGIFTGIIPFTVLGFACLCLTIPTGSINQCDKGWPRYTLQAFTAVQLLIITGYIIADMTGHYETAWKLVVPFAILTFMGSILTNWLASVTVERR
ncbi:MAG: tetratricopeptide repeat protein [Deltaproteobacteria bacterium]|nr:tetratricopeptide repeat protein [Deltaproteobacteria bacterium]